jgi:acetylornithine/N-succinyldiaminopimelate aminotransferase
MPGSARWWFRERLRRPLRSRPEHRPITLSVAELQALEQRYAMPTYARAPVEFVRGEGTRLWDADGREYLDFFAGLAVHNAGHCHPRIVAAIRDQAQRLAGVSNLYYTEPGMRLCRRLAESSLGGKVFLCNSGAEANECAIKLARKRAHGRGIAAPEIVVLDGAFHGRTLGTLAATPRLARDDLFGPLPAGFVAVPRDQPAALRDAICERTAAVMIEPIQGEAGVFPIDDRVLVAAREACDESGALLVFDEIQSGMGRTGSLWAYQQLPVSPDLITAAKALGGGLPVGACVTAPELGDVLERGDHGSTFAGAPIAAAAALAAIDVIDDPGLLRGTRELGARLMRRLAGLDGVAEVRGRGLMVGVSLAGGAEAAPVAARALEQGVVVNVPGPHMLRLLPPLTVGREEIDEAGSIIARVLA